MTIKAPVGHKLQAQKDVLEIDFSQWLAILAQPEAFFSGFTLFNSIKKREAAVVKDILAIEKTIGDMISGDYDALEID